MTHHNTHPVVRGVLVTLTAAFIVGGIILFGQVQAVAADQTSQRDMLDKIYSEVTTIRQKLYEDR